MQLNTYSKEWDQILNKMLDDGCDIKNINGYTATVGGVHLWIGNYPYSYGCPNNMDLRPSRKTIFRLRSAIISAVIVELTK